MTQLGLVLVLAFLVILRIARGKGITLLKQQSFKDRLGEEFSLITTVHYQLLVHRQQLGCS